MQYRKYEVCWKILMCVCVGVEYVHLFQVMLRHEDMSVKPQGHMTKHILQT